jgi:hypothetical protein
MKHASVAQRVDATYSYRDEQGKELYQVVRFHPKGFASGAEMRAGTLSGTGRYAAGHLPTFRASGETRAAAPGEADCLRRRGRKGCRDALSSWVIGDDEPRGGGKVARRV